MANWKNDQERAGPGVRAFLVPIMWIAALLASYWLLADWQSVPDLISGAFAAIP